MTLRDPQGIQRLRDRLGPVGVWTGGLDAVPAGELGAAARRIEAAGAGSLLFGEAYGREAYTQAGVLLAGTSTLLVGTGIANVFARDAVATRGAQATLGAVSGDRFLLGLGISHRPLVERMRGHDFQKPLATMRAYLDAIDEVGLLVADLPEAGPRLLAALGPRMLELSAERADGAHPYLTTPEHTARAREIVGEDKLLVVEQALAPVDDPEERHRRAHEHLEIYTGLPNYRNSWKRLGFDDDDFVRGGSDRLKDALVPLGVEAGLAAVAAHLEAGADQVVIQVLGESALELPLDDIEAVVTEAVRVHGRPTG